MAAIKHKVTNLNGSEYFPYLSYVVLTVTTELNPLSFSFEPWLHDTCFFAPLLTKLFRLKLGLLVKDIFMRNCVIWNKKYIAYKNLLTHWNLSLKLKKRFLLPFYIQTTVSVLKFMTINSKTPLPFWFEQFFCSAQTAWSPLISMQHSFTSCPLQSPIWQAHQLLSH